MEEDSRKSEEELLEKYQEVQRLKHANTLLNA